MIDGLLLLPVHKVIIISCTLILPDYPALYTEIVKYQIIFVPCHLQRNPQVGGLPQYERYSSGKVKCIISLVRISLIVVSRKISGIGDPGCIPKPHPIDT